METQPDRRGIEAPSILRYVLDPLYRLLTRLHVEGLANVPASGGCLLVFNHLSNLDPHLIMTVLPRRDATGLVAADYRARPFERVLVEAAGGLWLRRGAGDRAALERALELLADGWIVGIAPEGGRSRTGTLRPGQTGAAFLAERAQVPVLPLGLTGTHLVRDELRRLRRAQVSVRIGEPFRLPELATVRRRDRHRLHTETIMRRIAELLPAPYRGAYASPPLPGAVPVTTRPPTTRPPPAATNPLSTWSDA
jgi:1-acyl-sn-glycerol-3-phosphate acyltransferase